jgi:hypothetical protein
MARIKLQIGPEPEAAPTAFFSFKHHIGDRTERILLLINGIEVLWFSDNSRVIKRPLPPDELDELERLGYKFNARGEIETQ